VCLHFPEISLYAMELDDGFQVRVEEACRKQFLRSREPRVKLVRLDESVGEVKVESVLEQRLRNNQEEPDLLLRGVNVGLTGLLEEEESQCIKFPFELLNNSYVSGVEENIRFDSVARIGSLRSFVDLSGWKVDESVLADNRLGNLRAISFSGVIDLQFDLLKAFFTTCSQLRFVDLSGWEGSKRQVDTVLKSLGESTGLVLSQLYVSRTKASDKGLAFLAQFCLNLETLVAKECPNISDQGIELLLHPRRVGNFERLKFLDVSGSRNLEGTWSGSNHEPLAVSFLQECNLSRCTLRNGSIGQIARSAGPNLRVLNLEDCSEVSNTTLGEIGQNCPNLTELLLKNCRNISDAGILNLCRGVGIKNLQRINLDNSIVTDHGMTMLWQKHAGSLSILEWRALSPKDLSIEIQKAVERFGSQLAMKRLKCLENLRSKLLGKWLQLDGIQKTEIRCLDLSFHEHLVFEPLVRMCRISSIGELVISGCKNLCDDHLRFLLDACPRLRLLNVAKCDGLTDESIKYLAFSHAGRNALQEIDVSANTSMFSAEALTLLLIEVRNLRVLSARHQTRFRIDFQGKQTMQKRAMLRFLEVLDLTGCTAMGAQDMEFLHSCFPKLRKVLLNECPQLSFQHVSKFARTPHFVVKLSPSLQIKRKGADVTALWNARRILEEDSATKIQAKFRKYRKGPLTLQFLLLFDNGIAKKQACRIQEIWRRRKALRPFFEMLRRLDALRTIQRMVMHGIWRSRFRRMTEDVQAIERRKQMAKDYFEKDAASKLLQKTFRWFLYKISPQGIQERRLEIEAKEEVFWRKKQASWKPKLDEIFRAAALVGKRRLFAALVASYNTKKELLEKKDRACCSSCNCRFAIHWCDLCRNVLCHTCCFVSSSHRHQLICPVLEIQPTPSRELSTNTAEKTLKQARECVAAALDFLELRKAVFSELTEVAKRAMMAREMERSAKKQEVQNRRFSAAKKIQRYFRETKTARIALRVYSLKKTEEENFQKLKKYAACVLIQSNFRGHVVRKALQGVSNDVKPMKLKLIQEENNKSAARRTQDATLANLDSFWKTQSELHLLIGKIENTLTGRLTKLQYQSPVVESDARSMISLFLPILRLMKSQKKNPRPFIDLCVKYAEKDLKKAAEIDEFLKSTIRDTLNELLELKSATVYFKNVPDERLQKLSKDDAMLAASIKRKYFEDIEMKLIAERQAFAESARSTTETMYRQCERLFMIEKQRREGITALATQMSEILVFLKELQFNRSNAALVDKIIAARSEFWKNCEEFEGNLVLADMDLKFPPKRRSELKQLRREVSHDAWTATLPSRFFTDPRTKNWQKVVRTRVQEAMNHHVVVLHEKEKLERLEQERNRRREELVAKKEEEFVSESRGILAQQILAEARKSARSSSRFFEVLNSLFKGGGVESAAIRQQLSRMPTLGVNCVGVAHDLKFTVGRKETERFQREQDLRKTEGLVSWRPYPKNLGKESPIFLWLRESCEILDLIADVRVSHALEQSKKHISKLKGYSRVNHPKMTGEGRTPGLELMVKPHDEESALKRKGNKKKVFDGLIFVARIEFSVVAEEEAMLKEQGFTKLSPSNLGKFNLQDSLCMWVQFEKFGTKLDPNKGKAEKRMSAESIEKQLDLVKKQIAMEGSADFQMRKMKRQLEEKLEEAMREELQQRERLLVKASEFLALTKSDLQRLVDLFAAIDRDESAEISLEELFAFVEIEEKEFTFKLFKFLDEDNSGSLDFSEFVNVLATFCMFGTKEMATMIFTFASRDEEGRVTLQSVERLLGLANDCDPTEKPIVRNAMKYLESLALKDGSVVLEGFLEMNRRYPAALYPGIAIRDSMRKKFLGEHWWERKLSSYQKARQSLRASVESQLPKRTTTRSLSLPSV